MPPSPVITETGLLNGVCSRCWDYKDREFKTRFNEKLRNNYKQVIRTRTCHTNVIEYSRLKLEECTICLENFIDTDKIKILSCHHFFHANCIDKLGKCPFKCFE